MKRFNGGRVIALDGVNAVKDHAQGRKLAEGGMAIDSIELSDPNHPLKDLAAAGGAFTRGEFA